jgi:chorismate mutase
MTAPSLPAVDADRARIDELDAALARLVHERTAVSRRIQAARVAAGGRGWSRRARSRWSAAGGPSWADPGRAIAMALLELGRGRAG